MKNYIEFMNILKPFTHKDVKVNYNHWLFKMLNLIIWCIYPFRKSLEQAIEAYNELSPEDKLELQKTMIYYDKLSTEDKHKFKITLSE